jgi:subtilisin family serine protease
MLLERKIRVAFSAILFCNMAYAQTNLEAVDYYEALKVIESIDYQILDTPIVAIIDNGVNIMHEDLRGNIWRNHSEIPANGIDDDGNGFVDDLHGWNFSNNSSDVTADGSGNWHGTPVNGIIGASCGNSVGACGVCPAVRLMNIVKGDSVDSYIESLKYVYTMRDLYNQTDGEQGAFVVAVNCSWGLDSLWAADYQDWCAMYDKLGNVGVLCVNSVPNDNIDVDEFGDMPTTCQSDYLITVTNSKKNGDKVYDAAYGSVSVDLAAPGDNTYTALNNGGYGHFGGTSAAAPYVSGTVALLYLLPSDNFQQSVKDNPSQTALAVKESIMNGVKKSESFEGITVSGGQLNIFESVKLLCDNYESQYIYEKKLFEPLKIVSVSPNPAKTRVSLRLECQEDIDISFNITDLSGRAFIKENIFANQGINSVPIDVDCLINGIYIINIHSHNSTQRTKLIINS